MAHLAHYREAHPLPFVITHWINLVCMILLILSGIEIHYPVLPGLMGVARGVHIGCGILILINLIVRIILSFFVKSSPTGGTRFQSADILCWLPQKHSRHQLIPWIKYYLFFKKDHPLSGKYGVPQKIAYLVFVVFGLLAMGFTGLCLWQTTGNTGIFLAFTTLVGGLMKVRIIHYCGMFWFICFMLIHVYLANIEGIAPTKMMFLWKEHGGLTYDVDTMTIDGEDLMDEAPGEYKPLKAEA